MEKVATSDGADLLLGIQRGSSKAFEVFYDQYSKFVFSIAIKILKNKADAEDLTHDVFLEIHRSPYSYNPERGSIEAWLSIKTRSRALDRIRRNKKIVLNEDEKALNLTPDQQLVEEEVVLRQDRELLLEALEQLPESQRKAVYGNYFNEQSHSELSERLDRPLGTIKSLVRYGIRNLRKHFDSARGEKSNEL